MGYKMRAVMSGRILEIFYYEVEQIDPPCFGVEVSRGHSAAETDKLLNRYKSQNRAKSNINRLINSNCWQWFDINGKPYLPKFLTLTFADNITDLTQAHYEWKKFSQRLDWFVGYSVKYLSVVEFQKRGAVHYHVILFNLDFIPDGKLADLWGQGFIKVNAIDHVQNVGLYVSKYLGKDLTDDRLSGRKSFFRSRGLLEPLEIKDEARIQEMLDGLTCSQPSYEKSFVSNQYTGSVLYRQYIAPIIDTI